MLKLEILSAHSKTSGDEYRVGGITYLYIGRERTLLDGYYPQLEQALGLSGVVNYQIPVIRDENFIFDNGHRRRTRKYYIVANVDNLHKVSNGTLFYYSKTKK